MFSQEAKRNIVACRACWMCRHLCPVGLVTGNEDNTPRAKALLLNYAMGDEAFLKETAKDLYECALCNHCASWCETGYEPAVFIREGRRALVEEGALPEGVCAVVDRVLQPGCGLFGAKEFPARLLEAVKGLPEKAEVLLLVGDAAAAEETELALAAVRLLKKAGISFTVLREEPTAGAALYDLVGEIAPVQQAAQALAEQIRNTGCKTVVALDPSDARILVQDYPRWGCEIPASVATATCYVAALVEAQRLKIKTPYQKTITFHDPCRLARDLGETAPARKILAAMGVQLREMYLHGSQTRCCGGEVLASHSPSITQKTASMRLEDAQRTGAEEVVTACPGCLAVLRACSSGLPVKDIFCLLDSCC